MIVKKAKQKEKQDDPLNKIKDNNAIQIILPIHKDKENKIQKQKAKLTQERVLSTIDDNDFSSIDKINQSSFISEHGKQSLIK